MAKEYEVELPVVGVAYVTVIADSEEEAISKALDECASEHLETWNAMRRIVAGNVFYGDRNEASATEIGEVEE